MSEKTEKKPSKFGFFKSAKGEFKKIVWPSKKDVIKNTGVVIGFVVIIAVLVFIIDAGFSALFNGLVKLL